MYSNQFMSTFKLTDNPVLGCLASIDPTGVPLHADILKMDAIVGQMNALISA